MKKYKTILMDPPWAEIGGGKIKRGADRHYGVLKTPDIIQTILTSAWAPDRSGCHVWCWVTDNYLRDGLMIFDALGVRYIRTFCWTKILADSDGRSKIDEDGLPRLHMGLGQYGRGSHELVLFGVIGRQKALARDQRSVVCAPVTGHSRKPERFYDLIETVSPAPRLELFARHTRPGWDSWGAEVNAATSR